MDSRAVEVSPVPKESGTMQGNPTSYSEDKNPKSFTLAETKKSKTLIA